MTPHAPGSRVPAPALALLAALLAALLPGAFLGGCMPGTSTDAGNPELVIGFRQGGKPVDFKGNVRIFAADSNPAFYSLAPLDSKPPQVEIVRMDWDRYGTNGYLWSTATPVMRLDRRFLDEAAGYRAFLPLLPPHMQGDFAAQIAVQPGVEGLETHRPFNILLNHADSTSAVVEGITINALRTGYLAADHTPFDTLWVDLERRVAISGTIDTSGLADKPLIVFMPGTSLAAPVRGNSFRLPGAPRIKFPVRMVTRSGHVYAMEDSLDGTRSEAFYAADSSLILVPGERQDSVELPALLPFPAAPDAMPAGGITFTDSILVTLTAEPGADIYYTTGERDPDRESERYTDPVRLRSTTTLRAVAYRQGELLGPVSANLYVEVPHSPKAAPAGQAFRDSVVVTLATPARDGAIRYTLDGSDPHAASPAYRSPLIFRATTTLKAATFVAGTWPSDPIEETYTLLPDSVGAE